MKNVYFTQQYRETIIGEQKKQGELLIRKKMKNRNFLSGKKIVATALYL